ncbi:MAG TPA: hypothetical protein VFE45_15145 [Coriobacteriia bacterium]|nr:hypothetical protein [Coriobacteriia bacterium]
MDIKRVTVGGAGYLGGSLAQVLAIAGLVVVSADVDADTTKGPAPF